MVSSLFSGCCKIDSSQGEGSNICSMEEPEMCHTSHFSNMSAHRLSSSTTDLRVWQHHHYPIPCHLLLGVITFSQPFLYFQVNIMTFLRIGHIKKSHGFLLFCTLKAWRWSCTLQSSYFCKSCFVLSSEQWCKLIWLTPRRELGGFPTGIHHTSKSPLTLESTLTYVIPGENLMTWNRMRVAIKSGKGMKEKVLK